MVFVTFEEVTCRGLAETKDKYRLVLFASENRKGQLRSAYRPGIDVFGWKPPFKDPVAFGDSNSPLRISIQLRKKGWLGMSGRTVCSYVLELDGDCQSRNYELVAERAIQSAPRLTVIVTVAGFAANGIEQTPQINQEPVHAQLLVDPGTAEQELSVSLPNSPTAEPTPHPAPIEFPSPSSSPQTSSPVPVLQFSTPDDCEQQTSASPDGLDQSLHDDTHGLSISPPRPIAHVKSAQLLSAESAARKAKDEQLSIRQRLNSITDSISTVEPVASAASGLGDAMYSGVSRLDAVVQIIDVAANIHPLVKGVWSLLNVAYTLAKQQSDLDLKVGDLVDALDANCELARVLTEDQIAGVAETIVAKILREVLNGADVIKEYCSKRKSKMSAFKFAGSTTAIRIDACLQTLEVFRRNLAEHVAANVHRDLHALQTLALTLEDDLKAVKAQLDQVSKYVQHQEDDALLNQMPFAPEADRAMRSDERGCLPGTRGEIIEAIVHWAIGADVGPSQAYVRGLNPNSRVLWLCGVAGSGKSSIAISVARVLRSMGRLGAIYGFETALQTSLNPTNLFSTIARQRAEQQSGRKRHLLTTLKSMNRDQRATVSASDQFKSFLSTPATEDPAILDDVVVVDAFDESGAASQRTSTLLALSPEIHNFTFPKDVRFIVTSRYDLDVAPRLEGVTNGDQPLFSVLRMEDIRPLDIERDIRAYVFHKLESVVGLEASQATEEITQLAMAAEHSFQWASTACLYISQDDDDALRTPIIRLREILATRGSLYGLYLSILNQHFKSSLTLPSSATRPLRAILGSLVCALEPLSVQTIASLATADIPGSDVSAYRLVARRLSSIVTGTHDTSTPLIPLHTSFTDFLRDPEHSEDYAVASHDVHVLLGLACLTVMKRSLRFNMCDLKTSFLPNNAVPDLAERIKQHVPDELSYACRFWPAHVAAALSSHSPETEPLRQSLSAFLKNKLLLLQWLEVMSLTGTHAYESLNPLAFAQTNNGDLSDLLLFITNFSIPISLSVPHIYLSALAFTPSVSMIAPSKTRFPNLVHPNYNLPSWPQVRHKLEHPSEVRSIAWSLDGRSLMTGESGSLGGAIGLWDVHLGRMVLPRVTTTSGVLSVAVSRDGTLLASGHADGTVQLWDAITLSAEGDPLKGHSDCVRSVAFSPTDSLLASGSDDKTVALWDVVTHSMIGDRLEGHRDYVRSVAFSPDGKMLLSGSSDQTVRLWNVRTHSAVGDPLKGHTGCVCCVCFSPDGSLLASGSWDKTVRLWDARSGTAAGEPLAGHVDWVRFVAFLPDGQTLASCSDDRTIRIWDVQNRSPVGEPLTGHTGYVNSVAFSPNGALLASGSSDKTVHIWDARVLASNQESSATQFKIQTFAAFSRDGNLLASGSDGYAIQLWAVHSVSTIGEPLSHTKSINCVAFLPDGHLLASGSNDNTVRLWDVSTASAAGEPFEGRQGPVWALAFSPDGKLLASASWDEPIRFWDTHARSASGKPLTGHSDPVISLAFAPDGLVLASGDAGGTVRLWDVRAQSPIGQALKGHSNWVRCVMFSPDGTLLASGSRDLTVRLWDVQTQSTVGEPLKGHTGRVTSLAFSPDGALLVSSSESDNVVRVWDVRAPSEVGAPVALLQHESSVESIAFSPSSPLLSSITSGGVVRKWDLGYLLSASSSNLPNNPDDQLEEHPSLLLPDHPSLSALAPDFPLNLDDGWAIGPKGELVLWFPPALRPSIDDVRVIARSGGPPHVKLDFSHFVSGSDWADCYSPPPPTSTSNL